MAIILAVRKNTPKKKSSSLDFNNRSIKKIKPSKKIKLFSIVFFRHRLWKYIGNKNDKCVLELLPDERPIRDQKGYITTVNTAMCNLYLVDEPNDK